MPFVTHSGLPVHFQRKDGPGRPLIFVHGYCCSSADWAAQTTHFAGRHAVLAPDLPGHGYSQIRDDAWTVEFCAGAVGAVITESGARGAVLIGHSMGCRVVLQTYANHADRVAGIVLVDGSHVSSGDENAERVAAARIRAVGGPEWIDQSFEAMFLPGADPGLSRRIRQRALTTPPEAATRLLPSMFGWDATRMVPTLQMVSVPGLALQSTDLDVDLKRVAVSPGEQTPWLRTLQQHVNDCEIEVVPARSHFPMLEAPQALNVAIERFLGRLGS